MAITRVQTGTAATTTGTGTVTPSRINIRPPGTWTNVTFVLGPGWVGANPTVPAGATVSRDWQGLCINARDAWLAAH